MAVATALLSEAFGQAHLHTGLGIRRLAPDIHEFRASRDLRVVFELYGNRAELTMVGNHDEVRKLLRNR